MARLLWTNVFPLEGGGGVVEVIDWWNSIDGSDQWQRGIYFALCAAYALLSIAALVQLARIQLRVPEYGWTTQKVFHLMNFVVNGSRALLLGLYQSVFLIRPKALEQVLMDLPGLLFFSTYTLLVLFWAEIYHQARRTPAHRLRPAYFIINGIIYFTQVCIWISLTISRTSATVEAAKLFLSVISFAAAFGFLLYGGRLFFLLRRFPIESRGRQKKLYEVGSVTSICCACFMIRCVLLAISAFDKKADLDVLDHPILNLLYYLVIEIIPSGLVLFILRKLPPKRISDQYQPIR
ncbi:tobamovirus multiplication protein 1-like [Neltuma alba]|uniref:tobamovirus multiplication protein 1-like n=1 Tax=Neltuma alba TaxID=207710 RepID=UPI0010A59FFF|nr:tobamovirus multiplication protein 1-like [Prosopis alba]XP_028780633.1 tobamovirus multiplication protein 1-like [Prosopis alba]